MALFKSKPDPDTRTDKEVAEDARTALASLKRDIHRLHERGYSTRIGLVSKHMGEVLYSQVTGNFDIFKSKTETINL